MHEDKINEKHKTTKKQLVIVGRFKGGFENRLEKFDPIALSFKPLGHLNIREFCSILTFQKSIFAIAGSTSKEFYSSSVEGFNMLSKNVQEISMLKNKRWKCCAASSDREIMVCGGIDELSNSLNSCEVFSAKTNQWTDIASMKIDRTSAALVWFPNGRAYVLGGFNWNNSIVSTVEVLIRPWEASNSPTPSKSWKYVAPMNQKRYNFAATIVGDYIIVAGGFCGWTNMDILDSVEAYKPSREGDCLGLWTKIQPMSWRMPISALLYFKNSLFAFSDDDSNRIDCLKNTQVSTTSRKLHKLNYLKMLHEGKIADFEWSPIQALNQFIHFEGAVIIS